MKEIIYPQKDKIQYEDIECPNCSQKKLRYESIPCPEGIVGCLVIHYGYRCYNCGRIFSKSNQ